jgi:hypothetical protein
MYHKYGIGNAQTFLTENWTGKKKHVGRLGTYVKREFQGIVNRKGVDEMVEEAKKKEICSKNKSTRLIEKSGTRNETVYILHTSHPCTSLTSKTTNHPQCTQKNYWFSNMVVGLSCNETTTTKIFHSVMISV